MFVDIKNTGLVLEGGGMRGIFTIGVLDAFMAHGIKFPYAIGVSAGACNLCSYVSEQPGRARFSNIDMMDQYDYIGIRHLIRQGNIFDTKLLYDRLPNELYPFDYDKFFHSDTKYEMVTTNCITGQAEYMSEYSDPVRTMAIILASSSLPYVAKKVYVDGVPMLDGGVVDSIPVARAMDKGFSKNIIVVTRNKGYRKPVHTTWMKRLLLKTINMFFYPRYPKFRRALFDRAEIYNQQMELVEQLEREGRAIVIRPDKPLKVRRIEKDTKRLSELYEEGRRIGEEFINSLNS